MVGAVANTKVGELEDELREGFFTRPRKYFTCVVQELYGKRSFLVRLQDGCDKDLTSNQLTVMT